jgi:hypothetical protein
MAASHKHTATQILGGKVLANGSHKNFSPQVTYSGVITWALDDPLTSLFVVNILPERNNVILEYVQIVFVWEFFCLLHFGINVIEISPKLLHSAEFPKLVHIYIVSIILRFFP